MIVKVFSRIQRKIAWLLLFSVGSLCAVAWLIVTNQRNVERSGFWIDHTYHVMEQIEQAHTRIGTFVASSYQYAVDTSFRFPEQLASFHQELNGDLVRLRELTRDNADQQLLLQALSAYTGELRVLMDSASINRSRFFGIVHPMSAMLLSMRSDEKYLLAQRQLGSKLEGDKRVYILITGSILTFLFIVLILAQLNRDIMLRRRAEDALAENQVWVQSILDNTSSLIFIKDTAGRYIMANKKFGEVLNVDEKGIIGGSAYDFTPKDVADRYRIMDEDVIRTGLPLEREEIIPTENGDRHFLLVRFPLFDANKKIFGISGIATDITERVQYQQKLIAATKEAEEARGMQEIFLANMSHEIRTPMNGIQGMTNLLLDTDLTTAQRDFAQVIKRSVSNLLVIINDILDFSKIKANKLTIEKIDFKLPDILDNVGAMFAQRVKKKGLLLQIEADPSIPEQLNGDPYRLDQVLTNLVGNAIKFTEKGSIKVQVALKESTGQGMILLFTVTDTGIGIPKQSQPRLFESFSQAGVDIARRYGGTGLGLAICNQLVKLQGGTISVSSIEGEGSAFSFEIAYRESLPAVPIAQHTSISDYSTALSGMRFLVAEDNEINQKLIDHVLRKAGAGVTLVNNGAESISALLDDPDYDCIIMDLQMPVMDGYAATRHIRSQLRLQTPIIAMTATAFTGEQLRCLQAGMNDYMSKPFEFIDLYKRISVLLDRRTVSPAKPA